VQFVCVFTLNIRLTSYRLIEYSITTQIRLHSEKRRRRCSGGGWVTLIGWLDWQW